MQIQGRFLLVDGLRGVASFVVVLFHVSSGNHIPQLLSIVPSWIAQIVRHGDLGVAIFFVLSGFVIAHSIYGKQVTISFAGRFMLRRSLRLDPPYWATIFLTLALAFLSAKVVPGKLPPDISVGQLVTHILYLQDVLGYSSINTVFWTLSLEVQYYLIYVVMLLATQKNLRALYHGRLTIIIIGAAALVSLLWPTGVVQSGLWPGSFLPLWYSFLLGVGAYWSWRNPSFTPFLIAFMLAIAMCAILRADGFSFVSVLTACLLWASAVTGRIFKALNWSWLQFLGTISYSLYLTHNPIIGASFRAGYMLTEHTLLWETIWWFVSLAVCIVVAAAMYRLIEGPSIRLSRNLRLKSSTHDSNMVEGPPK